MNALERRTRRLLCLALLPPILAGCSQTMATGGTSPGAIEPAGIARTCDAWQSVSWSSRDTPQTIVEVKAANARRDAFCVPATAGAGGGAAR